MIEHQDDPSAGNGIRNTPVVIGPDRRTLRVFAFDPTGSRLSGQTIPLSIPFESSLRPGPSGDLVEVVDYDAVRKVWYSPVDLDDPLILAQSGLRPSESDPRSHQQIVYAVTMSVLERFQRFTGRRFRWHGPNKLKLVPHAFYGRNAYFDPDRGAVLFGYYRADDSDTEANLPRQLMFPCLSMDIIAHEVTHAVLHRLRPFLTVSTNVDVYAFHEGLADLVALFQHFVFPSIVEAEVASTRSQLSSAAALLNLASEFGKSTGRGGPLRRALDIDAAEKGEAEAKPSAERFMDSREPHERGAIFVAAVFDAFLATHKAQIADLLRIASGGTGILADGELAPDLVRRIAADASKNADRILGLVVRAIDYLPPLDVTFGDVVRAIITADRDLFPDDAMRFRARLVESLRQRGIYPPNVVSLASSALAWLPPVQHLQLNDGADPIELSQLILDSTLDLDPAVEIAVTRDRKFETMHQESDIQPEYFSHAARWAHVHALELGLDPAGGRIRVLGMHVAFQDGSDGQSRPRIFVQLVQRREDLEGGPDDNPLEQRHAGTTVIANVAGRVEYVICKPLPRSAAVPTTLTAELAAFVRHMNEEGQQRLKRMRAWSAAVEDRDPLAAWLAEPAVQRLSFANLHVQGDDDE